MGLVIVTGMSGAGKSTALNTFEDMGFFCMDNLPISLLPQLVELLSEPGAASKKTALGLDVRSGIENRAIFERTLDTMKESGFDFEILYLDSVDNVLLKRYKETRRRHPLSDGDRIIMGIEKERKEIEFLKQRADYILDTSRLLARELNESIQSIFRDKGSPFEMQITVLSFGFKHGIPADADLIFDVRFLPNPYYVEELRLQTGNDPPVRNYVMNNHKAKSFLEKLQDMTLFLLPNYVKEGKTQLVIAIGCTGGKHRSATLANALYGALQNQENYHVILEHRDIEK